MRFDQPNGKARLLRRGGTDRPAGSVFDLTRGASTGLRLRLSPCSPVVRTSSGEASNTDPHALGWLGDLCRESPAAGWLWDFAASQGWHVGFGAAENGGSVDFGQATIALDTKGLPPSCFTRPGHSRNTLFCDFVQALRAAWLDAHIGDAGYAHRAAAEVLLLERARAADGDAVLMLAAWELRCAGHPETWRHLIGSARGDIARAFADTVDRNPAAAHDGTAAAQAFGQWYADAARADAADHATLEALDREFDAFDARETGAAAELIEALAVLPGNVGYLAGMGWAICNDPVFSAVGSGINRTHLLHLTYDRKAVFVNDVPFRDECLARLIFPE